MPDFHTAISPSKLERVLLCPGSVALSAGEPEPKPTRYAAEGTVFHRVVASCLKYGIEPHDFLGVETVADGFEFIIDDEMCDHALDGLDRLEARGPRNMIIEKRVSLGEWFPGQSGTTDIGWYDDEWINVFDWKYGAGIAVSPFRNPQTMAYGLGFWNDIARHKTRAKRFRFIIEQPRNPAGGGEWECTLDDLLKWAKESGAIVRDAIKGKGKLNPGEKQCTFCPVKNKCPAYDRFALEAMQLEFDDLDAGKEKPKLPKLNMRRRVYIAEHYGFIKDWLDEQKRMVLDAALKGENTFRLKAVDGRSPHKKWKNEDDAFELLIDYIPEKELYTSKFISPAQALKKLTAKEQEKIGSVIEFGEPKPVLVPIEDKRESVKTIADMFEKLPTRRK